MPALGAFFGRRGWVDNLLDRLCGKLLSTQLTGLPADRPPRWRLDLEAKLDQAAESI
jgi:hypothetical protein